MALRLDGKIGFRIIGGNARDQAGTSVSAAGDINGDGIDDVIVGAPEAGRAFVVFGSQIGRPPSLDLGALMPETGIEFFGADVSRIGFFVSGGTDLNGDGNDDLLMGDVGGCGEAGSAYVVFDRGASVPPTQDLRAPDGANGFTIAEPVGSYSLFLDGAIGGDVNGDGFDDLVLGAPFVTQPSTALERRSSSLAATRGARQTWTRPRSMAATAFA